MMKSNNNHHYHHHHYYKKKKNKIYSNTWLRIELDSDERRSNPTLAFGPSSLTENFWRRTADSINPLFCNISLSSFWSIAKAVVNFWNSHWSCEEKIKYRIHIEVIIFGRFFLSFSSLVYCFFFFFLFLLLFTDFILEVRL